LESRASWEQLAESAEAKAADRLKEADRVAERNQWKVIRAFQNIKSAKPTSPIRPVTATTTGEGKRWMRCTPRCSGRRRRW